MTAPCWRAHTRSYWQVPHACSRPHARTLVFTLTLTLSYTFTHTPLLIHTYTLTCVHTHGRTRSHVHTHLLALTHFAPCSHTRSRSHIHPQPNTVTEFHLLTPLTCSLTDSPRVPPPESRAHLFAPWACSQVSCSSLLTIPCRLVPGKEELGQCRVPRGAAVTGKDCEEMLSFRRVTRKRREGWRCHLPPRGAGRTCVELGS